MTLFTDNPFEKMMIQKPNGRRDNAPPVPYPPACASSLIRGSPLVWGTVSENWKPNDRRNDKKDVLAIWNMI